jgi:PAS domain S-box-containing protein
VQIDARRVARVTLLLGLMFSLLLAVPFVIYYRSESQGHLSLRLAEKQRVIRLASEVIRLETDTVLSDLRYLSQNNEMRAYLAGVTPETRLGLAREYLGLLRQKRFYDQVRFIGLDGWERVRVNFENGRPRIVPDRELQYKGDRPYFREAARLTPRQIHISPFDLNVERGKVEQPFKPTLRFVIPVADERGRVAGMVVLNYLGQRLLDRLAKLDEQGGGLWLVDPRGYWLLGPTRQDEWGFMVPGREKRSLPALHSALWREISGREAARLPVSEGWIQFERVHPFTPQPDTREDDGYARPVASRDYHWTVAAVLPASALRTADAALAEKLWIIYGVWASFGFMLAGVLAFLSNRNAALSQVMENVVDNLPVLIAYVDAELRYRFNNMAYQRFFQQTPKQLFGKTLREVLGEDSYREIRPFVDQVLAGHPVSLERRLPYEHAGMRDVVVSYVPDFDAAGKVRGFFVMVSDVTPIKESERRERQRMIDLAHVSRLASLGEMATEIAHEINQPLAAIAMYSAACLRTDQGEGDRDRIAGWLEAINTQAKRASEVVRRLRRFIRKGELQQGPVDINEAAREVSALLRHDADSQEIGIDLELADDMPTVPAELILVEQVLFNLVRNAMESLARQAGPRRIIISTLFDERQVCLEVQDNGPGVDADLGGRIFESFMTDKREGMGMGLAISRSIVEAHGGSLGFANNPQGGATFRCCLPRKATP